MKRVLICGLLLLMAAPIAEARRKEKKGGEIVGNQFKDAEYGLELTLNENWKPKIGKAGDKTRLTLVQRNYSVPPDYKNVPDYTYIPIMIVFADTTTLGAHAFIDSLTSQTFKSGQKNAILKDFEILNEAELIPLQRSRMELAGESALMWKARANYKKEIRTSTSSSTSRMVNRSYGGAIAAVKVDGNILLFYVMSEWEYFEPVLSEVLPIIESLKAQREDEG
jgi:hypothetical protein